MNWISPIENARDAVASALAAGTSPFGLPAAQLLEHGSMKLFLYEPRGVDEQPVHEQDEVYVILSGSGRFVIGWSEDSLESVSFGPGDAIFTPAGAVHRFEDFTDDFATWVIMYGSSGGERPGRQQSIGLESNVGIKSAR